VTSSAALSLSMTSHDMYYVARHVSLPISSVGIDILAATTGPFISFRITGAANLRRGIVLRRLTRQMY
jgi:hypothetical protein